MPWNNVWPDGSKSTKNNRPTGQENTTYLETTLNKDHFFDAGSDEDGHHRFTQMKNSESGGSPIDPTIATGMDGVTYQKNSNGASQKFFRNSSTIYQITPTFLTGSVTLNSSSFVIVATVPNETFGYAWIFAFDGTRNGQFGSFKAAEGTCQAYSQLLFNSSKVAIENVSYGNGGNSSGLAFRAKTSTSPAGQYIYKIMCWAT